MNFKRINTAEEHAAALTHCGSLMAKGTPEAIEELSAWGVLISAYEAEQFKIGLPPGHEAIIIGLKRKGLKQKDLVGPCGSPGRVSQMVNGKRDLTAKDCAILAKLLDIPAEVLIQEAKPEPDAQQQIKLATFNEMMKRGMFAAIESCRQVMNNRLDCMAQLFHEAKLPASIHNRQGIKQAKNIDGDAVKAWHAFVLVQARKMECPKYKKGILTKPALRDIVHFSRPHDGPKLVVDYLRGLGIRVIVCPQLKRTRLDGMATCLEDGTPVIGLTLRFDRVDYFWFTLFHELAHIVLHVRPDRPVFMDADEKMEVGCQFEAEANGLAQESLIPATAWQDFDARPGIPSDVDVQLFAAEQRIHPAIVAGRLRRATGEYKRYSNLVGQRQVRNLFEETTVTS